MPRKILIKMNVVVAALVLFGCVPKNDQLKNTQPTEPKPISEPMVPPVADAATNKAPPMQPKDELKEPVQVEPTVTESTQTESITAAPKPDEPIQSEPIHTEAEESEPVKSEPMTSTVIAPESTVIEPKTIQPGNDKPVPVQQPQHNITAAIKTLTGNITLDQSNLKSKNASIEDTIVFFEPDNLIEIDLQPTHAVISTQNKEFKPNVLAITAGSEVSFPNMDRILHNVFSVSPQTEFDLGLYSAGTSKTVTFDEPGVIYVHCNVHHSMQADILVLNTPYFTQVDEHGYFELTDLPAAAGTLKIWHPRANILSLPLDNHNNTADLSQTVVITRDEVPKHRNKFGNPYRRQRY